MFDIGMTELLVIGIVSLIVVGPKDLPGMFRTLGRFTGKARQLGREFSRAMDAAADEAGVSEIKSGLEAAANPKKFGLDKINKAADSFEDWDPAAKVTKPKAAAKPETEASQPAKKPAAKKPAKKPAAKKSATTAKTSTAKATTAKTSKTASTKAASTKAAPKKAAAKTTKKPAAKKGDA